MRSAIQTSVFLALGLAATEGLAWWWMHPAPAGLGQPVLVYRPKVGADLRADRPPADSQPPTASASSTADSQPPTTGNSSSSLSTINSQPSTSSTSSKVTSLPEVVASALPSLRCSTGTASRIDRDDGATIHLAFFEWDLADSTNVLEAFKHLPDECMGSIGMTLIEKRPPRTYVVGAQKSENGRPETADRKSEVGIQKPLAAATAESESQSGWPKGSEANQQGADAGRRLPASSPSTINPQLSTSSASSSSPSTINPQLSTSSASSSSSSTINSQLSTSSTTLTFDHTVFRDPAGVTVHAFKGTWVSGASSLIGDGERGGVEQWNQLRWKSSLKRFRPAHARVAQGAVRGIPNPDVAWEAFESAMLADLKFQ